MCDGGIDFCGFPRSWSAPSVGRATDDGTTTAAVGTVPITVAAQYVFLSVGSRPFVFCTTKMVGRQTVRCLVWGKPGNACFDAPRVTGGVIFRKNFSKWCRASRPQISNPPDPIWSLHSVYLLLSYVFNTPTRERATYFGFGYKGI